MRLRNDLVRRQGMRGFTDNCGVCHNRDIKSEFVGASGDRHTGAEQGDAVRAVVGRPSVLCYPLINIGYIDGQSQGRRADSVFEVDDTGHVKDSRIQL